MGSAQRLGAPSRDHVDIREQGRSQNGLFAAAADRSGRRLPGGAGPPAAPIEVLVTRLLERTTASVGRRSRQLAEPTPAVQAIKGSVPGVR
jgi:hypothetical protein